VSATGGFGERTPGGPWWLRHIERNIRATFATLRRRPRGPAAWPSVAQFSIGAVIATAVVVAAMFILDAWSVREALLLPDAVRAAARRFTDLGKGGWFLWPLGILLLALACLDMSARSRFSRGIVAAFAVRLGFVFTAIAIPGLIETVLKRLIGRARPFVRGDDVWAYVPFSWSPAYASFPSGHATTAFSALVAIGAIFPQARALLWIYAILIALSRVVITAHYPSDVIAGAVMGAAGAFLVRNWFAARRLGLAVGPDGSPHAMPGPSLRRIIKAVAHRPHSA
jgi:membrane-associated phospholipid phosphatase